MSYPKKRFILLFLFCFVFGLFLIPTEFIKADHNKIGQPCGDVTNHCVGVPNLECVNNRCVQKCDQDDNCIPGLGLNWKGARCVGGNVDTPVIKEGRCVEGPEAGRGIPKGPQSGQSLLNLIDIITDWVFAVFTAIAVIYVVLAGFQFVTGGGEAAQVTGARHKLIYAVIGIGIALIAAGIDNILRAILEV